MRDASRSNRMPPGHSNANPSAPPFMAISWLQMRTTFLLIRHGDTDWIGKAFAGRQPGVHINERGRAQADALARRLAGSRHRRTVFESPGTRDGHRRAARPPSRPDDYEARPPDRDRHRRLDGQVLRGTRPHGSVATVSLLSQQHPAAGRRTDARRAGAGGHRTRGTARTPPRTRRSRCSATPT